MAGSGPPATRLFRFGPFELDVRASELRKHGMRVKLREQSVQILLMLLEHPGEVVLREEIRLRLWPNNTVVEFDHGINAAIRKLRDALGESADNPQYVETVGRRGYRFLVEVERAGEPRPEPAPAPVPVDADGLAGKVLSHYRIHDKLGEGGMGVVYRAEDLRLGRQVALKFLSGEDAESPDSMLRRFEREARAASALNHPNICTIHGLEDVAGRPAIVMELVEGETLAARLAKGPLPLDESVRLAGQIAGALAAAHRRGVVHRDLKPANIMLTGSRGRQSVKVLDFGLARMDRAVAATADAETLTQKGALIGTLHYMSPEQLQGKDADARSDIFSFGLVLYEMLAGRRPFEGESAASVMAGILEREAPPLEPVGLNRIVQTCLAKDPADRFQNADDLKRAIEWSASVEPEPAVAPPAAKGWIPWIASAVMFAALAMLVWHQLSPPASGPRRVTLSIFPQSGSPLRPVGGQASAPIISPDGSSIVYLTPDGIWVRRLDSLEPKLLRGSRDYSGAPFWSADSKAVAFPVLGQLFKMRVPDGAPEVVTELPAYTRGGTWSTNGTILVSSGDRLFAVPASGGTRSLVEVSGTRPGAREYPQFLPGSADFLFLLVPEDGAGAEVYLATLRDGKALNPVMLIKNDTAASFTPARGGRVLFVRNDNLYAQKLDRRGRKLMGEPELVQLGVASGPGAAVDHADFSVSDSGGVAWRPGRAALNQVTIFDRHGKEIGTVGPLRVFASVHLSADESKLLAEDEVSWLLNPGQPGIIRLGMGRWLWLPDGSHALGRTGRGNGVGALPIDGSGELRELGSVPGSMQDISPDGKYVLSMIRGGKTPGISVSHLGQQTGSVPIVNTGVGAHGPGFSPDGRWIVYAVVGGAKNVPGIYVQPFPGPGLPTQIAEVDGFPIWRRDGKEIVIADPQRVWSVRVEAAAAGLRFGVPELLFSGLRSPPGRNASERPLAVSRDGSRFYFPQAVQQPDSNIIHITMGW